jgi:tetratricopeptide (TPR) repeat protein
MKKGAWQQPLFSRSRERYIDSALALLPQNAYLWQQRSMPLFKQNKYQQGMPYLDSAVKYDAKNWLEYRAFMKCIFQKDYEAALIDFDLARSINGNSYVMDHPYDFYSALCHLQLGRFQQAEALLHGCIDERRQKLGDKWVHYVHLFYLGVVCFEQERYTEAQEHLKKCLDKYPDFSDAEYYMAATYVRQMDYKTALPIIKKAAADAAKGYTLNEDNVFYETYPYQVKKYYMSGLLAMVEDMNKEK